MFECLDYFYAPTVALALEYIREKKGIPCDVKYAIDEEGVYYWGRCQEDFRTIVNTEPYSSHREASSAVLDEALTILENQNKQQ